MNGKRFLLTLNIILVFVVLGCNNSSQTMSISGTIDYVGDAKLSINKSPLHYKYSPKQTFALDIDENGVFDINIPVSDQEMLTLNIDDQSILLVADPEDNLSLNIKRATFPLNVETKSIHQKDYHQYQNYLAETDGLDKVIEKEMNKYKALEKNTAIEQSQEKINLAEKHLSDTRFSSLILKAKGEMVVNKIKSIEYRFNQENFDPQEERLKVLKQAQEEGIFSFSSLKAQRAGIRDITHYYARTFGIYDSVKKAEELNLAEYDIKRLAYDELNKKRLQVLDFIDEREARAYARMFLVAERIGELDLRVAEPSYYSYLDEYSDFPEYIRFIDYFYNEIKSVSPGEQAKSFSLKDKDGDTYSLEDFQGKYVLLDFWAGWCQPCLDEFPEMRRIYEEFDRADFEIIGISTEVDKDVWLQDIAKFENPWIQVYGGNGFDQETFKEYKGGGIPFYVLVDRDGNIARYNDIRATFNLEEVLNELINE